MLQSAKGSFIKTEPKITFLRIEMLNEFNRTKKSCCKPEEESTSIIYRT